MNFNETKVCITIPPKIQSAGLWLQIFPDKSNNATASYDWYDYSLPRLEVNIALIFVVTQIFHFFLKRLGFPLFTSQIMAGLIFSEAIIGEKISKKMWTEEGIQVLGSIGTFGYAFFVFLIGVKTDPNMILRANKSAILSGFLSVIAPLFSVLLLVQETHQLDTKVDKLAKSKAMFLSPVYIWTAFPIITLLLSDMKILNSELGRICQSSGIIGDVITWFITIFCVVFSTGLRDDITSSLHLLAFFIAFCVILALVLRPAMLMIVRYTPEGKPVHPSCIYAILFMFLVCVGLMEWFGQFRLMAAYTFGLIVPHGPPLGSALVENFDSMTQNLLVPLFVSGFALRVKSINFSKNAFFQAEMAIVSLLVKFVACLLPQAYDRMPIKDALAFALIMCYKGYVEIANFSILFDEGVIDQNTFGIMFCVIFYVGSTVPIAVKHLYDPSRKYEGYIKRNLMGLKPNSELPILAVIHVPDNVGSIINLLEVSCPTKDNPMTINVLHLVKLSGQAAPIFISHQKKIRTHSTNSQSQNLIISFNKFEANYWEAVTVHTYTAVSPQNLMHDDICFLALDKLASLIILPFHRRWYIDGSVESDNDSIRTLNSRVLEKAPCSIGILVDRRNIRRAIKPLDSSYNVALIFIGGSDDREALTFAKRIAQGTNVVLTVVHLTANQNSSQGHVIENWDNIDSELLKEVQGNGYINYVEQSVGEGPETAMIIRSMVNEFNLIIVGRRQNLECPVIKGLKEWSEFPELGVLGDLLASVDYNGRCSVLVVQQQETVIRSNSLQ